MAGVKGSGGPPPKRSDQRRRTNSPPQEITKVDGGTEVVVPETWEKWHPVAKQWFDSLRTSGQRVFYESSDWATAYLLAEAISRELNPQPIVSVVDGETTVEMVSLPPKGASLAAWLKGMTALLVTEGDRRRASLELQRPKNGEGEGGAASVSHLDDARDRLRGAN
jgi:hypothetical protein